jgi:membrane-anchored protein YejM (alkaline phosphatase superfamily)
VHESFAGGTSDVRDGDMTAQLLAFIARRGREGRPFLGFAFYKSTHYSYDYPEETARFRPFATLNLALAPHQRTPTLYLNDYRNAVSHVDGLVGQIVDRLEQWGLLEETIIVVTSDHGEEFNDNEANYWGHGGNFTQYQTQVPLVLYVPGRPPRQVAQVTTHVDVPTTLVQEALRCGLDPHDYSNGQNLFGPLGDARPLVIGGYVNHALVLGDDVYVVYPFYVQKHKLSNIKAEAGAPRSDLARRSMEEMHRFFRPRGGRSEAAQ